MCAGRAGRLSAQAECDSQPRRCNRRGVWRCGEMVQASVFAQVVCLEVEAQGTSVMQKMQTFAAGTDIHARQVPQGVHNTEYRPGAVAPEMPTLLVGSKPERMQHARASMSERMRWRRPRAT